MPICSWHLPVENCNTLLLSKPVFVSVILSRLFRTNPGDLSKQEPHRYEFQLGPVIYPPGDLGNITYPLPASVSFSVKPGRRFLYPRTAGRTNDNMHKVEASWRNHFYKMLDFLNVPWYLKLQLNAPSSPFSGFIICSLSLFLRLCDCNCSPLALNLVVVIV